MTEEADNGGFLSHFTGLSLNNSLSSFQEFAPRGLILESRERKSWRSVDRMWL